MAQLHPLMSEFLGPFVGCLQMTGGGDELIVMNKQSPNGLISEWRCEVSTLCWTCITPPLLPLFLRVAAVTTPCHEQETPT